MTTKLNAKAAELQSASVADLAMLFDVCQVLEPIVHALANAPRCTEKGGALLDLLFVDHLSATQVAIVAELRRRVPDSEGDAALRSVALARWELLGRDFKEAERHVSDLFLAGVMAEAATGQ